LNPAADDPRNNPNASGRQSRALIERPEAMLPSTLLLAGHDHGGGGDDDTIDLRRYWQIIVKRKWTVLTFFLIVVVAVMTATFLQTKIYRSTLTLQIDQQESKVTQIQDVTPNETPAASKDFYQTQYELLQSRSLAERVIDRLNLGENPSFAPKPSIFARFFSSDDDKQPTANDRQTQLVTAFLKQLTIEPVRTSRLVKIHFESRDPQLSADVTNAVSDAFIALNLERRMDATSYAKTFLQERLQQMQVKLEDSEKKLNEFARQEQIVRTQDNQIGPDAQVLQEFTTALAKAQGERIKAETLYDQIKDSNSAGLGAVLENPVIQEFKTRKAKLETEYQENLKIYKPGYPKMLQIESQIAEMQAKIDEEIAEIRAAAKANYLAAKAQEAMFSQKLMEAKKAVLGVQDRSIQYNILKREVDTNRTLYEGLLQRLKEVGVAGGIGVNNITVVDKAEVPIRPYKPNVLVNGLVALFLGLFGGVGLALLFEHLDDTIKQPDDLEKLLGLPVLGIVPIVRNAGEDLVMAQNADPRSAFAEAHRSVRTALQFSTPQGTPKVLMITSSSMGEGKSTTALSLAIHFAQSGRNVLLIDADLRKASLHKKLNLSNEVGLTNYLAGDAKPIDITKACPVPKVYVMPSGPLPPNPADLLGSVKMVALLNLAAEKFDQVIIDGPPVLGLADAPLLGSIADATVLVVEANSTNRGFARNAAKRLRATRTVLIGGILTKLDPRGGGYGYYHNYYYYQYGAAMPERERLTA
jgi:capsular exopolysaccharide synthesis family protein